MSQESGNELKAQQDQSLDCGTESREGSVDERTEREHTFTRRAIVQAGWVIPTAIVLSMPEVAFAGSNGQTGHGDTINSTHNDVPHTDGTGQAHGDSPSPHSDFADSPHDDVLHTDIVSETHGDT